MFWQISSAVGVRLKGPSGLSTSRWREICFSVRAHRQSICSRRVSTRSCPYTVPLSRIPRQFRGCVSSSLGRPRPVRVSTFSSGRKGGGSSQRDSQSLHDWSLPLWPEKKWFANFLFLLTQPPLALPWWGWLLRQPYLNRFHHGFHVLNLHMWRLSSVSSESRAFLEDLLFICPAASGLPLLGCTRSSGCSSVVGVVEGALLQSTPLYP